MKRIFTKRVQSWIELIEEVYHDSWDPDVGAFRSSFVYRGICNTERGLSTTLLSTRAANLAGKPLAQFESHILRNFQKYGHASAPVGDSIWNWLALAQHHGLQTRLLDWTYSPFVAMHFVTERLDAYDLDGEIWCVNHRESNRLLPEPLRREAEHSGADAFSAEMLDRVCRTFEELEPLSDRDFVVFLEPPSLDIRIVNQFALFSMMSRGEARLDDWLAQYPRLARRLIVPARLKWEIRDKLDQAGITERLLYPGLDGTARWLSRYYLPRYGRRPDPPTADSPSISSCAAESSSASPRRTRRRG